MNCWPSSLKLSFHNTTDHYTSCFSLHKSKQSLLKTYIYNLVRTVRVWTNFRQVRTKQTDNNAIFNLLKQILQFLSVWISSTLKMNLYMDKEFRIWRIIFRYPEAALYLDVRMRKDSNIDLTDCLWCPACIWHYVNMLKDTQLDLVVNSFSVIKLFIKVNISAIPFTFPIEW